MLPRLKRFADVLAGGKQEGSALLRRALIRMLSERHRCPKESPLDDWAFSEVYRLWLGEHRDGASHPQPVRASHSSFERLFHAGGEAEFDALTANFLWHLPPQQRCALLLVHGEGFDPEAAASVLEATPDAILARLVKASAGLADRLCAPPQGETA